MFAWDKTHDRVGNHKKLPWRHQRGISLQFREYVIVRAVGTRTTMTDAFVGTRDCTCAVVFWAMDEPLTIVGWCRVGRVVWGRTGLCRI